MHGIIVFAGVGLATLMMQPQFPPPQAGDQQDNKPVPPPREQPQPNRDPTLGRYLLVSSAAIVGEIVSEPVREDKLFRYMQEKDPRTIHSCRVKILESMHGMLPKNHEMTMLTVRWADASDKLPAGVKKGEKYILFLTWNYGTLGPHTSDPWFGVQPYNAKMVELLRKMGNPPLR
jgi:hypothetical protein